MGKRNSRYTEEQIESFRMFFARFKPLFNTSQLEREIGIGRNILPNLFVFEPTKKGVYKRSLTDEQMDKFFALIDKVHAETLKIRNSGIF